ncbi:hypothetical protein SB777_34975, partial [Burkholderia sp. SIMBA_052]
PVRSASRLPLGRSTGSEAVMRARVLAVAVSRWIDDERGVTSIEYAGKVPASPDPSRRECGAALICKPKFMGVRFKAAIPASSKSIFDNVE